MDLQFLSINNKLNDKKCENSLGPTITEILTKTLMPSASNNANYITEWGK